MFLLDTNVVSELRRPERADVNVRAWASITPSELYAISVVTVLELERGTLLMERRASGLEVRYKGIDDPVTQADLEADAEAGGQDGHDEIGEEAAGIGGGEGEQVNGEADGANGDGRE